MPRLHHRTVNQKFEALGCSDLQRGAGWAQTHLHLGKSGIQHMTHLKEGNAFDHLLSFVPPLDSVPSLTTSLLKSVHIIPELVTQPTSLQISPR